ncbi:MAG: SurA N-terminal domain-containing protein [Paludibacter sp.]|nr:SurA N-terminal domain-containing protein [Paludibacter sp.]
MALLGKIRSKGVLLIVVIGLALFLFIVNDALTQGSSYFNKSRETVAKIDDEDINIKDYSVLIDQMTEVYKIETGQSELNEETMSQLRTSVWESLVNEKLLFAQSKKLGLVVSAEELSDRLIGKNIHSLIQQRRTFADENGQFSRNNLLQFYNSLQTPAENEEMRQQIEKAKIYWLFWERTIKVSLLQEKYNQLISKSVTANSLDAKINFDAGKNIVDAAYVVQPYYTIPDSLVKVSENEIKNLYNKKKEQFKQEANRSISYLTFNIKPSTEDFKEAEAWINRLSEEFKTTDDVSGLVNSNSDVMYNGHNFSEKGVPVLLKDFAFGNPAGSVLGPLFANDTYTMARVMQTGILQSDSVKLRHIFLTKNDETKADSIVGAIKGGADFAMLAKKYSAVKQTAVNGGEIGWIQEGTGIDKEITTPAFSKAVNEIFTIKNAQGVQIMQVTEKTAARRKVKLAILERKVVATSKTVSQFYNDAKQFVTGVTNFEKFENKAKEKGYIVRQANELLVTSDKISDIPQSRQIVRWVFEKEKGSVSDVFDCGNIFVVAVNTEVNEKGFTSLEKMSAQLKNELIRDKKAETIIKNLTTIISKTPALEKIAAALNTDIKDAPGVNFNTYQFGEAGMEPAVIGKVSSMSLNKISAPIKGNAGVYVVLIKNIAPNPAPFDAKSQIMQLNSRMSYSLAYSVLQNIKDKADITDNRLNFY